MLVHRLTGKVAGENGEFNCLPRNTGMNDEILAVRIRAHMGGDTVRFVCATIVHYDGVQPGKSVCGGERKFTDGKLLWIQRGAVRELL